MGGFAGYKGWPVQTLNFYLLEVLTRIMLRDSRKLPCSRVTLPMKYTQILTVSLYTLSVYHIFF